MILRVLAWVVMIGYAIHFASQLYHFGLEVAYWDFYRQPPDDSEGRPLLEGLDLWNYISVMSFVLILSGMFVFLWYRVIELLSEININNPFTAGVTKKLEGLAYHLFTIWLIATIGRQVVRRMSLDGDDTLNMVGVSTEFLFTAGIVFIISQIFKHGVALQQEQDLTI